MDVKRVTLEGKHVRLEPLSIDDHLDALQAAGAHVSIFEWYDRDYSSPAGIRDFVESCLADASAGTRVPFATVHRGDDEVVGTTSFLNIVPEHRRTEIGGTWITPDYQRTPVNTEAKCLMLCHAFETWECARVELKTDSRNERSKAAIERIGATREGILRKHMQTHQGPRDSVYYSIIDDEWPDVKGDLEAMLGRN